MRIKEVVFWQVTCNILIKITLCVWFFKDIGFNIGLDVYPALFNIKIPAIQQGL